MDAETNPTAKTITTIRYVHRKRISGKILGERRRNSGRKSRRPAYLGPDRYSPEQGDLVEQLASAVRDTGERVVADRDWEISLLV
jgi:hypothetical protein